MHRLRSTWFALIGGLLLVGLSVSSVFAALPTGTHDGTRGQTIAAFVHELVFGSTDEEQTPDEEQLEEEEQQQQQEEDTEPDDDTSGDDADEDAGANSHGRCVSEEASDKSDADYAADPEFTNHGAFVREAARVTCWQTDDEAPVVDAILDSGAELAPPDTDSTQVSAREQRRAAQEAAKAERKAAKSTNGHGGGNGHGRGGGRP